MLALVNGERLKKGKKSIGFLNPVLYKFAYREKGFVKDITEGDNPGCGTSGFEAVEGWDPVTGLGVLEFDGLSRVLLKLP
jgi:tripeptidyl-peptidase I